MSSSWSSPSRILSERPGPGDAKQGLQGDQTLVPGHRPRLNRGLGEVQMKMVQISMGLVGQSVGEGWRQGRKKELQGSAWAAVGSGDDDARRLIGGGDECQVVCCFINKRSSAARGRTFGNQLAVTCCGRAIVVTAGGTWGRGHLLAGQVVAVQDTPRRHAICHSAASVLNSVASSTEIQDSAGTARGVTERSYDGTASSISTPRVPRKGSLNDRTWRVPTAVIRRLWL